MVSMARLFRRAQTGVQQEGEVPMTPMIDVVFLLLIYFVMTLDPQPVFTHLPILAPSSGSPGAPSIQVQVYDAFFVVNERRVDRAGLRSALERIANARGALDPTLILIADPESRHQRLVEVLDACSEFDLRNLSLMTGT